MLVRLSTVPVVRVCCGAINGGRLIELHRDWALVELAENGSRRVFERRRLEAANLRPPWIGA
jgi:hypothetical protein